MEHFTSEVIVGIISKNRSTLLPTTIKSALEQINVDLVVSVFDDNSSDDTKNLKDQFPNVNWFFSSVNKGYVYGRNKLMSEATSLFYCSLDDDSWFMNGNELEIALNILQTEPSIAAIAFDILSPDRPNTVPRGIPIETNMFIGCGHVLRLSAVKSVNYYEENPGFYGGEEKDLCIRLMDKGYKIVRLPGVHVWHDKTMVARNTKAQHRSGVCNDLVFAYRRVPGLKVWAVVLFKTFSHLKFSIFYKKGMLIYACFQGLKDFYSMLVLKKIKRNAVSNSTFEKYMSFNQ